LQAWIKHSKRSAPPQQVLKPHVDVSPTLRFLAQIPSDSSTPLVVLNKKTAFLLAMAAFLRPSDLERISMHHCLISARGDLIIEIIAPKELLAGRRIVKTLTIRPNDHFKELCPVRAFLALKAHPLASKRPGNKLLVNSKNPSKLLKTTTISTWLRQLMRLSITQKHIPSVRSVASDLALARGVPLTDVVTMGNWSSAEVFDNHYRRQRLQRQNITNFVLRI
jgi:hypothetical protein